MPNPIPLPKPASLVVENQNVLEAKRRKLIEHKKRLEEQKKELDAALKTQEFIKYVLNDFYAFCVHVMGFKDLYEPLHRWLCNEIVDPKSNRKLILVPRGHFKTTIASVCYPVWLLCRNPCERIILASSISDKAEECLEEIVTRIDSDEFQAIFGKIIPPSNTWQRARSDMVRIPRRGSVTGPTLLCIGTDSAEVGRHCSRFIIDDMVGKDEVNSPAAREKAWAWLGRQLAVLDPGSEMTVIGTPWHSDDPYARLKRLKDWKVLQRSYIENGAYIFPTRFNDEVVRGIREIMDDYTFACFYELRPISEDINPFKIDRFGFIEYDQKKDPKSDVWTYVMVDPAVSTEDYSCPSGIVIADAIKTEAGDKFVIKEAISAKMHPDQLVETIFQLVIEHKPRSVIIESEAQQKTFHYWIKQEMVRRKLSFVIEEVRSARNITKFQRILGLQPYLHNKVYVIDKNMAGYEDMMTEFTTYPKGKTDDLICALSLAIPVVTFPARKDKIDIVEVPKQSRLLMEMMNKSRRKPSRVPRLRWR